MEKSIFIFLIAAFGFSNAYASGCFDDNQLDKELFMQVGTEYVKSPVLSVDGRTVILSIKDNKNVKFNYFDKGMRISASDILFMKDAIASGSYKVKALLKENVLFSYENDCDGPKYGSTGRYKLMVKINNSELVLVYPMIEDALSWRYGTDHILPIFNN